MQPKTYEFDECQVRTIGNTPATIPAGRHLTMPLYSARGVSIRPAGRNGRGGPVRLGSLAGRKTGQALAH